MPHRPEPLGISRNSGARSHHVGFRASVEAAIEHLRSGLIIYAVANPCSSVAICHPVLSRLAPACPAVQQRRHCLSTWRTFVGQLSPSARVSRGDLHDLVREDCFVCLSWSFRRPQPSATTSPPESQTSLSYASVARASTSAHEKLVNWREIDHHGTQTGRRSLRR